MPSFRMMLVSHKFNSTNVNYNQYFHDFYLDTQIPRAVSRCSLNCTSASCCHKNRYDNISHCLSTLKMVPLIPYYSYQHMNLSCLKQYVAISYVIVSRTFHSFNTGDHINDLNINVKSNSLRTPWPKIFSLLLLNSNL